MELENSTWVIVEDHNSHLIHILHLILLIFTFLTFYAVVKQQITVR